MVVNIYSIMDILAWIQIDWHMTVTRHWGVNPDFFFLKRVSNLQTKVDNHKEMQRTQPPANLRWGFPHSGYAGEVSWAAGPHTTMLQQVRI